jgi:hypothetical protein
VDLEAEASDDECAPEESVEDDEDEIDPAVETSDEYAVQQVVNELNGDEVEDDDDSIGELRKLTSEEINLGCFSLTKVNYFSSRGPFSNVYFSAHKSWQAGIQ